MRFEWDERKRLANLNKHGLDFIDAVEIFEAPHALVPSKTGNPEKRFLAIGMLEQRYVTIVFTERNENIRIISFRRARYEEKQTYQKLFGSRA